MNKHLRKTDNEKQQHLDTYVQLLILLDKAGVISTKQKWTFINQLFDFLRGKSKR